MARLVWDAGPAPDVMGHEIGVEGGEMVRLGRVRRSDTVSEPAPGSTAPFGLRAYDTSDNSQVVYHFRLKSCCGFVKDFTTGTKGLVSFLGDHGQHAGIGVVGVGCADAAPESAVETFEITRGAQARPRPSGMLGFQLVVGDGAAKVAAQGGDGGGLVLAILATDAHVAAERGGVVFARPDCGGVFEDGPPLASALLGGQFGVQLERVGDIAQLVEQTALLGGVEVDGLQGCAQAWATIVDDQAEAIGVANALGLQQTEKAEPGFGVFAGAQLPDQLLPAPGSGPHAQGDEDRPFAPLFDGPATPAPIGAQLIRRLHLGEPNGIVLQDGWHLLGIQVRGQFE